MARKMKFKAELQQVMEIIVNSLYSHKEIFLRELISNASDAIDNLRYQSLTRPELATKEETWEIRLVPDAKARTLTVRDNGIGMTREEILTLKEGEKEFLDEWRIKEVVKKFSDFLEHPVILVTKEAEDEEKAKEEILNHRKAIWLRPQSEVSEQEYAEFYKHISRDIADPAKIIHFVAEGRLEFRAILFIPAKKPFDMLWHPVASGL